MPVRPTLGGDFTNLSTFAWCSSKDPSCVNEIQNSHQGRFSHYAGVACRARQQFTSCFESAPSNIRADSRTVSRVTIAFLVNEGVKDVFNSIQPNRYP